MHPPSGTDYRPQVLILTTFTAHAEAEHIGLRDLQVPEQPHEVRG
jgi:hypothetical protein